jgi:hypothetical protein
MDRMDLIDVLRRAEAVRATSKAAFGRDHLIETCLAAASLGDTFVFDDLMAALGETCGELEVSPPSASTVRQDLNRLRGTFRAVERLPAVRGERLRREARHASAIWTLCRELAEPH